MKTIGLFVFAGIMGVCMPVSAQVCQSNIRASTPASDFVDNGNGTATHAKTGLTWMRCALGQSWTGSTCSGSTKGYTWQQALAKAKSLNANGGYGGWKDWRLPNINELRSIVEDQCYMPTIRTSVFPDTPNAGFWSASPLADFPILAWVVYFDNGTNSGGSKGLDGANGVRLVRGGQSFAAFTAERVVLLLHGMNSSPATWDDLKSAYFDTCPVIFAGVPKATAKLNSQGARCYRVDFGQFDEAGDPGLENARQFAIDNGMDLAGDFSTFGNLGTEVKEAIHGILSKHPNAYVTLLGHSRGGLAARAFLQKPVASIEKSRVAALITTGSPHAGSRLGRIYRYIKTYLLDANGNRIGANDGGDNEEDWEVVDFLIKDAYFLIPKDRIDVRRPTINYLADNSPQIADLQAGRNNLPAGIHYGQMAYKGVNLGLLSDTKVGYYSVFDRPFIPDIGEQLSPSSERCLLGAFPVSGGCRLNGHTPADYKGDGIVRAVDQLAGLPGALNWSPAIADPRVLHTGEPGQTNDIATMFCKLGFSQWLNDCSGAPSAALPVETAEPLQDDPRFSAELQQRQQNYERWLETPTVQLWPLWRGLNHGGDTLHRDLLGMALIERLRQGDSGGVYEKAREWLPQAAAPLSERARLAVLLGEAETPQAVQTLLAQLREGGDPALRNAVLSVIARLGDSRWGERFHEELSPSLRNAWRGADNDPALLSALASALAKIGAPGDVALLLQAVEESGLLPETLFAAKTPLSEIDARSRAAFYALDELRNPDAVPVLAAQLQRSTPGAALFQASGGALAAMGLAQAAEALVQWAQQAPDEARPQAEQWFGQVRDEASLRAWRQALSQRHAFRSGAVFDGVRGVLERLETR